MHGCICLKVHTTLVNWQSYNSRRYGCLPTKLETQLGRFESRILRFLDTQETRSIPPHKVITTMLYIKIALCKNTLIKKKTI